MSLKSTYNRIVEELSSEATLERFFHAAGRGIGYTILVLMVIMVVAQLTMWIDRKESKPAKTLPTLTRRVVDVKKPVQRDPNLLPSLEEAFSTPPVINTTKESK